MPSKTALSTPCLSDILQPNRNAFGLLRLLAALAVVVSHSVHLAGAPESAEPLASATGYSLGEHAVHVFFTISGVLIAASLVRSSQNLGIYFRARALRLLPGLSVCVLLTGLVLGPMMTELPLRSYFGDLGVLRYIALSLGLVTANAPLPGVFSHNPVAAIVDLPLWTLKYEALCYLGLGVLGLTGIMGSRRAATLVLTPLLLGWVAVAAFPDALSVGSTTHSFLRLAFSFGLGTLAYVWRDRLLLHWWGVALAWFAMAVLLGTRFQAPAEQAFLAYATLWAASLPAGWLGATTRKTDLSYGVYIYDWPIAQCVVKLLPGISQPLLLAATLVLLMPVAALSWFLIEKPALGWKQGSGVNAAGSAERQRLALRAATSEPANVGRRAPPKTEQSPVFPATGSARERLQHIAGRPTVQVTVVEGVGA